MGRHLVDKRTTGFKGLLIEVRNLDIEYKCTSKLDMDIDNKCP